MEVKKKIMEGLERTPKIKKKKIQSLEREQKFLPRILRKKNQKY